MCGRDTPAALLATASEAACPCVLRQLLGCPTASPLASSPSDQASPSLFMLDLSASTSPKLSFVKSCGSTSCSASWVPWWRMLIKEKRPVKFVIASAKQKRGSLSAGFLV